MRSPLSVSIRFIVWFFLVPAAPGFALPCPSHPAFWKAWQWIEARSLMGTHFQSEALAETVSRQQWVLEACKFEWESNPKTRKCMAPIAHFSRALWLESQPGHSLGLEVTDEAFYQSPPFSKMMELPDALTDNEFLKLLDHAEDLKSLDKALAYIDLANSKMKSPSDRFIAFIYRSQHLPTPDDTDALGRFFVFVPGKDFDRYFQFGLRDNPANPLPHGFSLVAVQKTNPKNGLPLAEPRARLKDFWRKRDEKSNIDLSTRLTEKGSVENCYDCHKHAALPITPDPSVFDESRFGENLRKVNHLMSDYVSLRYDGLESSHYGPALGPEESIVRTDKFIKECAGSRVAPLRYPRLKKAMQCASCHDGIEHGQLNYPAGLREVSKLIGKDMLYHYVVKHKKMPKGAKDLSQDEREALVDCLKAEYYRGSSEGPGLLQRWLEQRECWAAP